MKKEKKSNPLVLVFANESKPGANFKGGGGQEEDIYRRTSLAYCVDSDLFRQIVSNKNLDYNLKEAGCIYAPNVLVFRKYITDGYKYCLPETLNFVLSPPLNKPKLDGSKFLDKGQQERAERRMRTVLTVALEKNHDSIVLGAWGCGHARNHPKAILKLINKLITTEFPHAFRYVVFAVVDDPESIPEVTKPTDEKSEPNQVVFKHFLEKSHEKHCVTF